MDKKWVSSVAFAQYQAYEKLMPPLAGKTVQATLENGLPGESFRVVLGEHYGAVEIRYGSAVVQVGDTQVQLLFGGERAVAVPPGQLVYSDAVGLPVKQGDAIKLWLYIEGDICSSSATICPAVHSSVGNYAGKCFTAESFETGIPGFADEEHLCGVFGLQVQTDAAAPVGSIVAFGDSITKMGFWTGPLKQQITCLDENTTLLNMGIGGNRLLLDTHIPYIPGVQMFGKAGLTRYAWDVAELSGAKTVMVALGINDISQPGGAPGMSPPGEERCTFDALCKGYQELAALVRKAGMKVVGCTITPFGGYATYNGDTAALRNKANRWIQESGTFDAVVDFAAAVCQQDNPDYMKPEYDTGDHLHPNEAGGQAMAACVDVKMLLSL